MVPKIYAVRQIDSSVMITQMANGWKVDFPKPYPKEDTQRDVSTGILDGLQGVLPIFKEMMKLKDQDPLLTQLQDQGDQEDHPGEPDPEPEILIGQEKYCYVFGTFREVLTFLDDKFTGEDGY